MPVISGADLSQVSTKYEALPAGTYRTRISAEYKQDPKPVVLIRHKVLEGGDMEGREFSDYIYLNKNNGERNEIALKQLKRYFEAVLGEEQANQTEPDTDLLKDREVIVELTQESYTKPQSPEQQASGEKNETKVNNKVKRVLAA